MAVMCAMLHDLRKSVEHYRNWLNKQGAGQANVHAAEEPLPRPDTAKNYSIVEVLPLGQPPTSLALSLLDRKVDDNRTADYEPINVNDYMVGLANNRGHCFMLRLKDGLSYPVHLWS
eukprot:jgi/Tetstr1/456350/TSEL_043086.t1